MESKLHAFSIAAAACALVQIVAGALVTSKEAGLSIPDWPLNYGRLIPQLEGGIAYEFAHRVMALLVAGFTGVLAIWLWKADERAWVRPLGFFLLGGVLLQIVLGGMAVLMLLPPAVSSMHASLAQILFAGVCSIAAVTSSSWRMASGLASNDALLRRLAAIVPATVLIQIALGAAARHKVIGYVWHIAAASVVSGMILWATVRALVQHAGNPALRRAAVILISVLLIQVFLGIAAYMSRLATVDAIQPQPVMVGFTALHVATGALTFAAAVIFGIQAWRGAPSGGGPAEAGWAPAK
jgi:cytochrome c oxidase assembly protein subunit 15